MLSEVLFIILTKKGEKCVLPQIMPCIEPHRYEMHHSSKLLDQVVIIVMDESSMKYVKGDKRGSHNAFQKNYDELVDNSTPYCLPITSIKKPKASLEESIYIRQLP